MNSPANFNSPDGDLMNFNSPDGHLLLLDIGGAVCVAMSAAAPMMARLATHVAALVGYNSPDGDVDFEAALVRHAAG